MYHKAPLTHATILIILALFAGGSYNASAQTTSPQPEMSTTLSGKLRGAAHKRLAKQLANQGTTRVLVRFRSTDEPAAELTGKQTRSRKAGKERRKSIQRLVQRIRGKLPRSMRARAKSFKNIPYLVMDVNSAELEQLALLPEVVELYEDKPFKLVLNDSVPQMGAELAVLDGYTGEGYAVAVLDTGVERSHSAFQGKQITEACFSTTSGASQSFSLCPSGNNPFGADEQIGPGSAENCTTMFGCDHGTHVAGIALSNDPVYTGVAPDADLIAVQVFSGLNDFLACGLLPPCLSAFTSDVIRGLEWVYEQRDSHDIAAVNMSLGGEFYTTQAECDSVYPGIKDAIANLRSVGIATVIASGNDGVAGALSAPACLTGAISVGAVNDSDQITSFANTAEFLTTLTPGSGIISSVPGNGFAGKDGTSMAAPHGAGAVAVLNSANPDATVDEIVAAITDTGIPIFDPIGGYVIPRIQLDAAADELRGPMLSDVNLAFELFASGFNDPVAIGHAGDATGRLFVAQSDGQIFIVQADGSTVTQPFLDLSADVLCCSGLLSFAFHPAYAANGTFFVKMVDSVGDIVVNRYTVSSDPDAIDPVSVLPVLVIPDPGGDHYGGQLQFGSDGYLYIGFGDGAVDGTFTNTAGDPDSLLGKLVRINVDSATDLYDIPIDNPFVDDDNTLDEIWALGLRDPWRFSFDRLTGDLFIADRGEPDNEPLIFHEEVNLQSFQSTGGEDYGWSLMDGSQCFPGQTCDPTGLSIPIAEYTHDEGCAVTGGNVYRGPNYEELQGVYVYADACSGNVSGLLHDGEAWQSQRLRETPYEVASFGEDEVGNVYLADSATGFVYLLKQSDLIIDTESLPNAVIGRSYSHPLVATGGAQPYQWSVVDGALPSGLVLNPGSGEIQGTALALGPTTFTVQVEDAQLSIISLEVELTVTTPPPIIQAATFPDGDVAEAYAANIEVVDGTPPLVWSVVSGSLPAGLTLDSFTGAISGAPTTVGNNTFTVSVVDSQALSDTQAFSIEVKEIVELIVGELETGQYGHEYGSDNHYVELVATFSGGVEDLMLNVVGYDIDYADEVLVSLNGTPLGNLSRGSNNTVNAGDSFALPLGLQIAGENIVLFEQVRSPGFTWGVTNLLLAPPPGPPVVATQTLPEAQEDTAYSATLSVSSGLPAYSWSLASGTLPAGVTLSTAGELTGTPTESGSFNIVIQVSDGLSRTDTQALTLVVTTLDIVLTIGTLETGQYGHEYGTDLHLVELVATFTGGTEDLVLSVDGYDIDVPNEVAVSLNGISLGNLSLGPNNGLNGGDSFALPLSQNLQVPGENTLSFKQVGSVGYTWGVTNILLAPIDSPPAIDTQTLPDALKNDAYSTSLSATGGLPPYDWSLSSGVLPAGMSLSSAGELSGTPTQSGSFDFEVRVVDGFAQADTQALTLIVNSLDLILTLGVLETGQYGHNYGTNAHLIELNATFVGGTDELTVSVDGYDIDYSNEVQVLLNGFPLGHLSAGANNGLNGGDSFALSTSLQFLGENTLTFRQVRSIGYKWGVTNILLGSNSAPPVIATQALPEAFKDVAYAETLTATGGALPYDWTLSSGTLPSGMTLSASGNLSGTPSESGTFVLDVQVSDSTSQTDVQTITLVVNSLEVALFVGELETGQYGHNYGSNAHLEELLATFTGGIEDLILSVDGYDIDYNDEVLVSLNGSTLGYLSAGPGNALNAGDSFTLPIGQQDVGENILSFKQARSVGYKWGVTNILLESISGPPVIATETLADGVKGTPYATTLTAAGGLAPYSWTLTSGSLPAGVTLSSDGELSGTPTEQGSFNVQVEVTDSLNQSDTQSLSLTITSLDILLTLDVLETGKYGYKYGTNEHQGGISLVFENANANMVLTLNGYDIDYANEVSISLNGTPIGFLAKGANNRLNAGDTIQLDIGTLAPGTNTVRLNQERNPNYKWGATNFLLMLAN